MSTYSSRDAARKLGLSPSALSKYVLKKKIPTPQSVTTGGITVYLWTETEIEHVRQLLPKIANGRKTRYSKLLEKQKAPARVPVPHKKRKPKKK
jgi:predicted transcriptional regulator